MRGAPVQRNQVESGRPDEGGRMSTAHMLMRSRTAIVGILLLVLLSAVARAQTAPQCVPGMRVLASGSHCPENCVRPADFPGYDPAVPRSFSRNQERVGVCAAMASADYICYELRRMGRWPQSAEAAQGCSALDLEVQAFTEEKSHLDPNTIRKLLGAFLDENSQVTETNRVDHNADDFVSLVEERGICPESRFPSEFATHGGLRDVYLGVERRLRDYQPAPAAEAKIDDVCPECRWIAPTLTDAEWSEVLRFVAVLPERAQNTFEIIAKINELACPAPTRIHLPEDHHLCCDDFAALEQHLEEKGSLAVASFHAHELSPRTIPESRDLHAAVVYGARVIKSSKNSDTKNPDAKDADAGDGDNEACYYTIKNSWGPAACRTLAPDVLCDPDTGAFLVRDRLLRRILKGAYWGDFTAP
jgi:hypothetical protein